MRVVLDTNVVVSALLWRGTPYRLLDAIARQPSVQIFSSIALLDELAAVLNRPYAARRLALIGLTARDVLTSFVLAVELAEPASVPRVVPGDPDDDEVIAAAVAADAALIVSGDRRHLLPLRQYRGIEIVEAAEALRRIEA